MSDEKIAKPDEERNVGTYDQMSIRGLLDACGLLGVANAQDDERDEAEERALDTFAFIHSQVGPARQAVLSRDARRIMVEVWGWSDWEARDAIQRVSRVTPDVPAPPFRWYDDERLRTLQPPDPLIHGLVDEGAFFGMYGPPDSGKSFLALDMALSVGTGRRFHGHDVAQGSVAYILAEGVGGIRQRVDAWMGAHECTINHNVQFLLEPVHFLEPNHAAKRRLDLICTWACVGMLPGSVAGAANRSVEVFLKSLESDHTAELKALRGRVGELEQELAQRKTFTYAH